MLCRSQAANAALDAKTLVTAATLYQLDFLPDATAGQADRLVLTMYGMSVTGRRK